MENAGARVVEFLSRRFAPLASRRIVVLCGKGNNGGDGLVIARQLFTRFRPRSLDVVLLADPVEMRGDAAANVMVVDGLAVLLVSSAPSAASQASIPPSRRRTSR